MWETKKKVVNITKTKLFASNHKGITTSRITTQYTELQLLVQSVSQSYNILHSSTWQPHKLA